MEDLINEVLELGVDEYKGHYKNAYGVDTKLDDREIATVVVEAADDMEPAQWAAEMKNLEAKLNK